jgi:hypothetical protein
MDRRLVTMWTSLLLLLAISPSAQAQISSGVQIRLGINTSSIESSPIELEHASGFQCALALEFLQKSVFSFQVELEYAKRGFSNKSIGIIEEEGIDPPVIVAFTSLNYLSVPFSCRIRLPSAKKFEPYLLFGPRLEFLAWRQLGVWEFNSLTSEDPLAKDFRDISIGLSLGIGISTGKVLDRESRVEVRHCLGLTDLMPDSSAFTVKHRSVDFSFVLLL